MQHIVAIWTQTGTMCDIYVTADPPVV